MGLYKNFKRRNKARELIYTDGTISNDYLSLEGGEKEVIIRRPSIDNYFMYKAKYLYNRFSFQFGLFEKIKINIGD